MRIITDLRCIYKQSRLYKAWTYNNNYIMNTKFIKEYNINRALCRSVVLDNDKIIARVYYTVASCSNECIICYDNDSEEQCTICNVCHKSMHIGCIDRWFNDRYDKTCPHCISIWKFDVDIHDAQYPYKTLKTLKINIKGYKENKEQRENDVYTPG